MATHGQHLTGFRTVLGNAIELLVGGDQVYPAMLDAIAAAKTSVAVESYIFSPDRTGQRFLDALVAAAQRGMRVRVIVDGVGSMDLPETFFSPLRREGGRVAVFGPPKPWLPRWSLWKRDHRKILVVDDQIGFIGGLNIGDDYAPESWGGDGWHDAHARLSGPAARELTKVFNRTWRKLKREDGNRYLQASTHAGEVEVQILESRLTQRHSVRRAYLQAIRRARSQVRISNAYCIPDLGVRRALRNACKRGVQVQLLLAGQTDVRMVRYASRHLYTRMLRWGVEIYEWTEKVLHAKTAVVDGAWCSIGSYNMDTRSLLYNLEANIAAVDPRLGAVMDRQFEQDLERSVRIDSNTWHRRAPTERLFESVCYALRYLL